MKRLGPAGRLAGQFLHSRLTPLLIAAALGLGALALLATPREEEPQIRVPMIDVTVALPGAEPEEIERLVVDPLERALWGLPHVDHLYSTARPGVGLVTARFAVNASNEDSLARVSERLSALGGQLPAGASAPTIELHAIDDVPFLALTLWGNNLSSDALRPIAAELAQELAQVPQTSHVRVLGGQPREVRVEPDPERLAASGATWIDLESALRSAAARRDAGVAVRENRALRLETGPRLATAEDVGAVVLGVRGGRPLYVHDVARIVDGPGEAVDAVLFTRGAAGAGGGPAHDVQAVTLSLAKRPGANASELARSVLGKLDDLRPHLLPAGLHVEVTRNYGETAAEKSNELVQHLLIATLSVAILLSLALGWRNGMVVGIAVPVTLALTLFVYYIAGYTLNRVTLFALIFSIGILVDDAIVVVENIERHRREKPGRPLERVATEAVDEVGNPTILATFTVIAAILPMAFVRGLMGPYMRPIPTGASAAMLISLAVAFVVTPWAAYRIFRRQRPRREAVESEPIERRPEGRATAQYRRVMTALIARPVARWGFFAGVLVVLLGACALVGLGAVRVKMLPFDNKSEFQVLIDHDPGTPLEVTLATAREMSRALAGEREVTDVTVYAGLAAPHNFNGLVRHYFLRRSPASADLQVNLVRKGARSAQSHEIAKRVRPMLVAIAERRGARVKVIEIPPGPPVLDTLVAEIYGPSPAARERAAVQVRETLLHSPGVVDVDTSLEAPHLRRVLDVDRERSALLGISPASAFATLANPGTGVVVAQLDEPAAREAVPVRLRLGASDRGSSARRLALRVLGAGGAAIALDRLVTVGDRAEPQPIVHKDLRPLVYVFGDLAGARESPVYAIADLDRALDRLTLDGGARLQRSSTSPPSTSDRTALKWDGEWQITYEVFRDLGIAFAIVLALIAILVVGWFESFTVPLAILLPIPLSLIGILPGHLLFGAFFTATSMIGFIAGAGIIVRNSIILVDFIELKVRQGMPLERAVVEAGVVRFRPMLLTAAAVVVGSLVILFDPIFQGLAISLMMGEVAATLLSRIAVPVVYYLVARGHRAEFLRREGPALEPSTA
ncbi:MAG: efflux RND transporter permease subunit [Acidobacteriota bacterium]